MGKSVFAFSTELNTWQIQVLHHSYAKIQYLQKAALVIDLQHSLQWRMTNFYWLAVYIVSPSNIICEV